MTFVKAIVGALKVLWNSWIDQFPKYVVGKLDSFPESSMDCWIVAVKTRDGREFRQIVIGNGYFGVGHFAHFLGDLTWKLPFRLRDVIDIEWEGYRVGTTVKRPEPFRDEWKFRSS